MVEQWIHITGASEHNLKNLDLNIPKNAITVITGVSGSGKSSLAFDTILRESQRRFFYTLSHYARQFLDLGTKPKVKAIQGLSPALGLAQRETNPSPKARLATLSDMGELLGVLLSRFGMCYCPDHPQIALEKSPPSQELWLQRIYETQKDQMILIGIPIVESKKGHFKAIFHEYVKQGYLKAIVDGQLLELQPYPELHKHQKHSIHILVDSIKVQEKNKARFIRAFRLALNEQQHYISCFSLEAGLEKPVFFFSKKEGCPICGYTAPLLDPRYFQANSIGACLACEGIGCEECCETGLSHKMTHVVYRGKNAHKLHHLSLSDMGMWLSSIKAQNEAENLTIKSLLAHIKSLEDLELGFLSLYRRAVTLSRGELQRIKIAGLLATELTGMIYVLDEPSQGLHPSQIQHLFSVLRKIQEKGNTVLIVDHDLELMRQSDYILDMGPKGGMKEGGYVLGLYKPQDAHQWIHRSLTAQYLVEPNWSKQKRPVQSFLTVRDITCRHLKIPELKLAKGRINTVTGLSGSGKTTLVLEYLAPYFLKTGEQVFIIDSSMPGKSHVSMPGTYLDVFSYVRDLFGRLPESQILGFSSSHFSLLKRDGARCPACEGRGFQILAMKFLSDAHIVCAFCKGNRYQSFVDHILYQGLSISEWLHLSIEDVLKKASVHPLIQKRLTPAYELGIGYLSLGQPCSVLSGGEAQRLKLAKLFQKIHQKDPIYILDEPSSGLHAQDIEKLMNQLRLLSDIQNSTIILIDNDPQILDQTDCLLSLS